MTGLCQLEARALTWQLAYFGPKVVYVGRIFQDTNFKFVLQVSVTKRLISSATINIFCSCYC